MKTKIFYFSGTGNSLSIARKISSELADSELFSIPHAVKSQESVSGDVIGIVCPIYMYNMPLIVSDFLKLINDAEYIFFVYAGAGELGNGDRETENAFTQNNLKLSSLFNIKMPSNYSPYGSTPPEIQKELFSNVDKRAKEIIDIVNRKSDFRDTTNTGFFKANIHPGILYKLGYSRINILDQSFSVDETCNGCGICQKVCPVDNVTIIDDKPTWNKQCQQCYACLQWCPKEAIQAGKRTVGVKRYHHPDIKVKDIMTSSPG